MDSSNTKICGMCKEFKELQLFYKDNRSKDGLQSSCKLCRSSRTKPGGCYYEKHLAQCKIQRDKTKEKKKAYNKLYAKNNKEIMRKHHTAYAKKRRASDPLFKLAINVRNRIRLALKTKGFKKNHKSFDLVGCSLAELAIHIESQFKDDMSWSNQGKWHIDHKIPLSSVDTEIEILRLCHYTNLQPLWALENIKKGNK